MNAPPHTWPCRSCPRLIAVHPKNVNATISLSVASLATSQDELLKDMAVVDVYNLLSPPSERSDTGGYTVFTFVCVCLCVCIHP